MICNCTIIIVFAAFYIESNLNHIIETMSKTKEMIDYYEHRPGLQEKLIWFYISYYTNDKTIMNKKVYKEIRNRFVGFNESIILGMTYHMV